jgi:hypothetical protein
VVRELSFCSYKATASLGFTRKPPSVYESYGIIYFIPEMGFRAKKVYNYSLTHCFSGYDDLNVYTFLYNLPCTYSTT